MNNILVTGGAGYIGSITCKLLAQKGFRPIIFDSLEKGHRSSVNDFKLVKGKIQDRELLAKTIREENIKAVIHFAAYIQMGESMAKPGKYFQNNFEGSLSLLEIMAKSGLDKIIFSSTAGVYGNPKKLPISENDPKNPTNPYGESKLMVERLLSWYDKIFGIKSICLRYFNACGAWEDGSLGEDHDPETHLIPNLLKAVIYDREFILNGNDYQTRDGTCVRDYIHVVDLAEAHILALQSLLTGDKSDIFNIGTAKGFSNLEIISMVEKVTGKKVKLKTGPRRPGDANVLIADNGKFCRKFSWQPQYSDPENIVRTAYLWHKER